MKILILGGTKFVGRWVADVASRRGHEVTLFHRGQTNPDLFPNLEHLHGDRDGGLAPLEGRRWDAVIDTCGYVPRLVRASCELLADATSHYTFISTCSVYADQSEPGQDEDARLAELDDPTVEEITGETYGGLKVLCEESCRKCFGERALILRPGLIVGPHDPTDRFTYWPVRIASSPVVLGAPADAIVEFTDVRDLVEFVLDGMERRLAGAFNVTGPSPEKIRFEDFARECQKVAGTAEVLFPQVEFLAENHVLPWSDLPLWTQPSEPGFSTRDTRRAIAEGLELRSASETIQSTLEWARTASDGSGPFKSLRAGLTREREEKLIAKFPRGSSPPS